MKTFDDQCRKILDELVQEAGLFAAASMKVYGEVKPSLIFHGADGLGVFAASDMSDAECKEEFTRNARLVCIAYRAQAVVFVAEAWIRLPNAVQKLDLSVPPSEAPDRQEAVILIGESREAHVNKIMPIKRSPKGQFTAFAKPLQIGGDTVDGRFTHFLSQNIPDEKSRRQASRVLEKKGITVEKRKKRAREKKDRKKQLAS